MPGSVVLHIVRHGESTDNLKSLWAGWKNAPLSLHGMRQAERLGDSLADVHIDRVYCSDLKRAHWTAIQVHKWNKGKQAMAHDTAQHASESLPSSPAQVAGPQSVNEVEERDEDDTGAAAAPQTNSKSGLPVPITTQLLREQHFGKAEGQPWSSGPYSHTDWGDYRFHFEDGEALADVAARADEIVRRVVLPWADVAAQGSEDLTVVLVAHGIMISQLSQALVRHSTSPRASGHFGGLQNTSYHTFKVTLADPPAAPLKLSDLPHDELPPPYADTTASYVLKIEQTGEVGHLEGLKRQKGGIGRMAYDSNQKTLKDFFGGGGSGPTKRAARA